jgi:hypothetical protein
MGASPGELFFTMNRTLPRQLLMRLLLALITLAPMGIMANPGDLYVSIFNTGEVWWNRLNPFPGSFLGLAAITTGLSGPVGLAFDGAGNLYEADQSSGSIYKIIAPLIRTPFATGLNGPTTLAFDKAGNLFEVDQFSNTIFKFAADGTKSTFASGLNAPVSLVFDKAGNLFVGEQGSASILKFAPNGDKTTFASGLNDPAGLAFDSLGNLFVAEFVGGSVFKYAPDGTQGTFLSGLDGPAALAIDGSGNVFVAEYFGKAVTKYDANGNFIFIARFADLGPFGLALEPTPRRLSNISTRGAVGIGPNVLIGGFIVTGNGLGNSSVLIRALGPSLTQSGVDGALQDPMVQLFDSDGVEVGTNDNWKTTQQAEIEATGIPPTDDREAAILETLAPGAYTAIVSGVQNATGVGLVEVYQLN